MLYMGSTFKLIVRRCCMGEGSVAIMFGHMLMFLKVLLS